MNLIIKLSISLGIICAIAAGLLSVAYTTTLPEIEKKQAKIQMEALQQVLPEFDKFTKIECGQNKKKVIFFKATKNNKLVGIAAEGASYTGFGGKFQILVGIDPNSDTVRTVVVTEHNETPGLGTAITNRVNKKNIFNFWKKDSSTALPANQYLDHFSKKNLIQNTPFKVTKDGGTLVAKAGATVSSRALANAVTIVADAYKTNKSKILGNDK